MKNLVITNNVGDSKDQRHCYFQESPQEVFMPYFVDLVLNWILITKPSTLVVKEVWENIVAFGRCTEERLSYVLLVDFMQVVLDTGLYDDLFTYQAWRPGRAMDYQNESCEIIIPNPLRTFKRVNEIGHCVLGLPIDKSAYKKCTDYGGRHHYIQCYTLVLEFGYYVVRDTTFEEFHEQCIQAEDCIKDKESSNEWCTYSECWFRAHHTSTPLHYMLMEPYISLLLNRKEVVDDILNKMDPLSHEVTLMKVMYSYH